MSPSRLPPMLRVLGCLLCAASLHSAALALNERGAKAVIDKFLAAQKIDEGSASPGLHAIADIDGDGRDDLVLQWDILGPTWSRPMMSVFLDQGRSYRTLTTDLTGLIEKLVVQRTAIVLDTKVLGPKDARCCPSVHKRVVYRWVNGKLTLDK